jgi:hypothetical protein
MCFAHWGVCHNSNKNMNSNGRKVGIDANCAVGESHLSTTRFKQKG